ncbi:MAG: hypothetical protein IIC50_24830 [Planctomycetes bacterium]|nr:hypothetical protein [Planctomycetota bacterium]
MNRRRERGFSSRWAGHAKSFSVVTGGTLRRVRMDATEFRRAMGDLL